MLGINERREPVKGVFVNTIVDSLRRASKGELNDKERACESMLDNARSKYVFVWE